MPEQLSFDFAPPSERLPQLWSVEEVFQAANQHILQKFKEDRRLDWKSSRIQPGALAESISMFANTAPDGGVIVVGIENDGKIAGCVSVGHARLNAIEQASRDFCPEARSNTRRMGVVNSAGEQDFVVLIHVEYRADRLVETTSSEAFIRVGDTKRKLSAEEKRELRINKGEIDYELEDVKLDYPDDFDQELISHYCSSYKNNRGIDPNHPNQDILALSHLGEIRTSKFKPNLACALVFGKDPARLTPGAKMRFLRFDGIEEGFGSKFNAVKDIWVEGSLPRQIVEMAKILRSQVRDFTRLGPDKKFYTRAEYPEEAWYEALVNACVHRSYNLKNMNIFVKMFDDRLVIESPGGFPPLVTPENIYSMHSPRNPHLMQAMFYLDFVKCAHEGTRRMRETMRESALPAPVFSQVEKGNLQVQVTLKNDIAHRKAFVDASAARLIGESIFAGLSEAEKLIINYLAEQKKINVTDCQRVTGRGWQFCKNLLDGLVQKRILELHKPTQRVRDPKLHYTLRVPNGH